MLLITHALANINEQPNKMRGNRYQPNVVTSALVAANNAVAPAGGCTVFVKLITTEEVPTASAPASHRILSKRRCGSKAKNFVMPMPMMADRKCPTTRLRG